MTQTYSINGIMCNSCRAHVKEQIEKHPDVTSVEIEGVIWMNIMRKPKEAVISMNQHISIEDLQLFMDKDSEHAGRYSIS